MPAIRRLRAGVGSPGAGSSAQAPRYATMPAPLAKESTREREAHERRIHCKRFADAAADAREHAVALHARDARERDR